MSRGRKSITILLYVRVLLKKKPENSKWFFDGCRDIIDFSDDTLRGVSIKASNVYTIDIDIHELASIVHKELILIEPRCKEGLWEVEIYDYWRE